MSREPNPIDDEDLYNVITLGGVRSPGQVVLSGHDRNDKWDVKSAPGQKGATTSHNGDDPAQFTATFFFLRDNYASADDYEFWPAFRALIDSTVNGTAVKAIDIYHPDLAENGIKSVCRASIGGRVHDGKGGSSVAVKFQEYRPAKKQKGGSPNGSKTGAKKPAAPDPNAAALAELEALTKQYKETPWG